jgi:hypothetical protein
VVAVAVTLHRAGPRRGCEADEEVGHRPGIRLPVRAVAWLRDVAGHPDALRHTVEAQSGMVRLVSGDLPPTVLGGPDGKSLNKRGGVHNAEQATAD